MNIEGVYFTEETMVTPRSWEAFYQRGYVGIANVPGRPTAVSNLSPAHRTVEMLRWDLHDPGAVITGYPLGKNCRPQKSNSSMGIYVKVPHPSWRAPWHNDRKIAYDNPLIAGHAVERLLVDSSTGPKRWDIWRLFGSEDIYRCWGPDVLSSSCFLGTIEVVINYIFDFEYAFPLAH